MKTLKKKTSELKIGDILILNWLEMLDSNELKDNVRIIGRSRLMINKFEGESCVMLYEIDDIDIEYVNGEDEKDGNIFTLYHSDSLFGEHRAIAFEGIDDYKWDVIENPSRIKYSKSNDDLLYNSAFGSSIYKDHPDFNLEKIEDLVPDQEMFVK